MELVKMMSERSKKIEELREELFQLEHGLEAAEVVHKGNEAMVMEVDWNEKVVLLNYDDENMEWISFDEVE